MHRTQEARLIAPGDRPPTISIIFSTMISQNRFHCKHCNRSNIKSQGGLTLHLRTCQFRVQPGNAEVPDDCSAGSSISVDEVSNQGGEDVLDMSLVLESPPRLPNRMDDTSQDQLAFPNHGVDAEEASILPSDVESGDESGEESEFDDDSLPYLDLDYDSDTSSEASRHDRDGNAPFFGGAGGESEGPDTTIRDQFRTFVDGIYHHNQPFSPGEKASIRCLNILQRKKASLDAYKPLMEWHYREAGDLKPHQSVKDHPTYIGRNAMLKRLAKRYNMEDKFPTEKWVKLPVSGMKVKIAVHDAGAAIQSLLTDPRITDDDYLFFDDDPLAPPPPDEDLLYVKDLNTGRAYIDTHRILIGDAEGKQLLPIILYIDGAQTSNFHNMEIISVRISLGIFTKEARRKDHFWRSLGYVIDSPRSVGKSQSYYRESNHMDVRDRATNSDAAVNNVEVVDGVGKSKVQDFHAQLDVILQGLIDMQEHGIMWDLCYKGVTYRIHYMLFVPFVKCDTKEADAFCGKYQSRNSTKQICRYCHIALEDADDHLHKPKPKTVTEIKRLVDRRDLEGLKQISQLYLRNAFYKVRFNMQNDRGIHGACPSEMLHALLLGVFRYVRNIFFEFLGPESSLANDVNALALTFSKAFARQSERDMPHTRFTKGIQKGRLMAKEYRGILLLMLTILKSTKGRALVSVKKKTLGKDDIVSDWIMLLEMLLEWEVYLNEPVMEVKILKRLHRKHQYLMYLMRQVTPRTKGKGLKLMKFHAILHAVADILLYGVPTEFDTGSNEGHHIIAKYAALLTQKAEATFHYQTAKRLVEFLIIALAAFEIDTDRVIWDYFDEYEEDSAQESGGSDPNLDVDGGIAEEESKGQDSGPLPSEISTGGARIEVDRCPKSGGITWKFISRSKFKAETRLDKDLMHFLCDLQEKTLPFLPGNHLDILTEHTRGTQTYRGHPNFRGKEPWRDWVWVNWGAEGKYPSHIWCFVDLQALKHGHGHINHGGIRVKAGTYAVVESSDFSVDESADCILLPLKKEVEDDGKGNVQKRSFYLANTDAFVKPCCVIPDYGGPFNRYFLVRPRSEWKDLFIAWLKDPHKNDDMT